jgi:hypothetical protein
MRCRSVVAMQATCSQPVADVVVFSNPATGKPVTSTATTRLAPLVRP